MLKENDCVMLMLCVVIAWRYVFSFRPYQSLCLNAWRPRFFFRQARMARIQVIMAMTSDGFLPDTDDRLVQWVKTDKKGFPYWRKKCAMTILPHSLLDLICEKDEEDDTYTYLAEITDTETLELLRGLFLYNLVDEIIIYQLPLFSGGGISVRNIFPSRCWNLLESTFFPNGICRMIYRKTCNM